MAKAEIGLGLDILRRAAIRGDAELPRGRDEPRAGGDLDAMDVAGEGRTDGFGIERLEHGRSAARALPRPQAPAPRTLARRQRSGDKNAK